MVSRNDLLRAVGTALSAAVQDGSAGDDAATLVRLHEELDQQPWFTARNVSFAVKEGVVTLEGIVTDERTHAALRVAAQNVSGMAEVRDELVVIDARNRPVIAGV